MDSLLGLGVVLKLLVLGRGAAIKLAELLCVLGLQAARLLYKLLQRLGRQDGVLVVHGLGRVHLVDGHRGVDGARLDGLLLNHGLDVLVDMVIDVLAHDGRRLRRRVAGVVSYTRVGVLGLVGRQLGVEVLGVKLVKRLGLHGHGAGLMLSVTDKVSV